MKAEIYLNNSKTKERYGLHFERGVAYTDNCYLINKLKEKGLKIKIIEEKSTDKSLSRMNLEELKNIAIEKGIDVLENATKKEIFKLIAEDEKEKSESDPAEDEKEKSESDGSTL